MRNSAPNLLLLLLAIAPLTLSACAARDYRSFPEAAAASTRVHATIAEQSQTLDHTSDINELELEERKRYIIRVIDAMGELERHRIGLLGERFTPAEARQVDTALAVVYSQFETYARFPGRVREDGRAADDSTEQALAALSQDPDL